MGCNQAFAKVNSYFFLPRETLSRESTDKLALCYYVVCFYIKNNFYILFCSYKKIRYCITSVTVACLFYIAYAYFNKHILLKRKQFLIR